MDYPDLSHLLARSKQIADESAAASRIKREHELLPPFAASVNPAAVAVDDCDDDGNEIKVLGIGNDEIDDDFTTDEIEKMILEMKDNPLPDGKDSAIIVNQAFRDLLKEMTKKLDTFEIRQRDEEKHIEQLLVRSKLTFERQKPGFSKVKALQYIPPYFHDASNLCPPSNEDAVHKIRNTPNFNILCDVPRPFSKKEDDELKTAISQILNDRLPKPGSKKRKNIAVNDLLREEINNCGRKIAKSRTSQKNSPSTVLTSSDWSEIATMYMSAGRTATECQLYWNNFLNPEINKDRKWTKTELDELKRLCSQENPRLTFCQIAESLKTNRTAFQCAEKYQNELNENLINKQWTAEEDARLTDIVETCQQGDYIPWDTVAHYMEEKLRSQCQNRWERALNPALRRGRWTEEEDKKILEAVHKFGTGDWSKIAQQMSNRSVNQCRERYCTVLDVGIKMSRWTVQEDAVLLVGIETFGLGSWSKIRLLLPGRTAAMCKNRHISLKRRILRDLSKKRASEAIIENKRRKKEEKQAKRLERIMSNQRNKQNRFRNKKHEEENEGSGTETLAAYVRPLIETENEHRKRGRPHKLPGSESCADRKRRFISDLLKEKIAATTTTNDEDMQNQNFVTLTITREQLIMNSGKENFRLMRHIERKTRVTQWCLQEHGQLPISGLISQDVTDFIDSQPDEIKCTLREKMEKIYTGQDIAVHRIPLNLKNMVL